MAEASFEDEVDTESAESIDLQAKMTKPPDKRKHEAAIAELMVQIEAKQQEQRTLGSNSSDKTSDQLRSLRTEKEGALRNRREIEGGISALTQEIRKKNNELTKVQSNLQGYRSEARIDEAILKLEYQLSMNNFRLSDERKMVSEIDNLKRSKKVLCVVNSLKREIGGMKDRQRQLRERRDCYFKKVNELKQKEEAHKRKAQADKLRHEELKKEIDALYEEKRTTIGQFKAQEKEFHRYREGLRVKQNHEKFLKKEERRLAYEQELAEYEMSREPYQDEKQLCNTLLAYLQNILPITSPETSQETEESERASSGHDSDTLAQSLESEGLYLLKKKQEDLFAGITKSKTHRKSKKDKKRVMAQNKKINHSPQTLQQFAELRIKAPTTVQDVHETMQQVESKKLHYECLPPPQLIIPQHFVDGLPSDEMGSAGTPSVTESAIAESIPSTPEVQGDATVNPFLREGASGGSSPWRHQRKLSLDSGAYDEDDDELKTPDCDGKFNNLQSIENSTAATHDKIATGDFPRKSELSRRTLSTVSSLSDKDSSASSDTIVDSPQIKSCDDFKVASPLDNLNVPSDSLEGATSRDYPLGPDWPVLSRENSNSSQKSPSLELSDRFGSQELMSKVAIDSYGIVNKNSFVPVHNPFETAQFAKSGQSSLEQTEFGNETLFPLAAPLAGESQSEDSLQLGINIQSYQSFQSTMPADKSGDRTQEMTQHESGSTLNTSQCQKVTESVS